jgi:hypothetical protein
VANFEHPDVQAICTIPLNMDAQDTWAWHLERNGKYSVCSAYRARIAKERQTESPNGLGVRLIFLEEFMENGCTS